MASSIKEVISWIMSYFKSSSSLTKEDCCFDVDMECLASEVKLFGECLLRLNRCVYCVVEPDSRRLVYTFTETQEPLHVSDEWVVFRTQVYSLRDKGRRIALNYRTKARVLDVNDSTILYSDGTALRFVVTDENTRQSQVQAKADISEFHLLTPTGFAVQDRDHSKVHDLNTDRTVTLVNVVPSNRHSSRYILNHHGDAHVIVHSSNDEKLEEHWVVDTKGHKFRIPHPLTKIHRRFIQLQPPELTFSRNETSGQWEVVKDSDNAKKKTTKRRAWAALMDASHALVRVEDYVGRNASSWMLMNTGIKLEKSE